MIIETLCLVHRILWHFQIFLTTDSIKGSSFTPSPALPAILWTVFWWMLWKSYPHPPKLDALHLASSYTDNTYVLKMSIHWVCWRLGFRDPLWRGHKHPCSFQLRIALNLKSTRHYVRIDMAPYVKSRTSAQHNCKTWEVVLADCCLFRCISLNIDDWCMRW